MITFDDARAAVADAAGVRSFYPENDFLIADYGWEDNNRFLIVAGTKADLFDGDPDDVTIDPPIVFVDKTTGAVTAQLGLQVLGDPTDGMTAIGNTPE
jgi:hypothetical protein